MGGYQPLPGPPGGPGKPLHLMHPNLVNALDRLAHERHAMSVYDMQAALQYWQRRWRELDRCWVFRWSTWKRLRTEKDEATRACLTWAKRLQSLRVASTPP